MKAKIKVKAKVRENIEEIPITTEFIKLDAFLKFAAIAETGGMAKAMIEDEIVFVNGEICTQRGKKLHSDDVITVEDQKFRITKGE